MQLDAHALPPSQLEVLAAETEAALRRDADFAVYDFEVSAKKNGPNSTGEPVITVVLKEDGKASDSVSNLLSMTPSLEITRASTSKDTAPELVAQEVRRIFKDEQASIGYLLQDSSFSTASKNFQLDQATTQAIEKRTTRAFKYASTYHVTFSLFAASASPSAWEIKEAVQKYIKPLLHQLSSVSNFHVDTQVQLFATFSPSIAGPQLDEESNTYKLLHSDLSGFINAAEWPLSPSIGAGPTINMVLYVPSPSQSPLVLETGGNSWTIPQWGGVQILNPNNTHTTSLTTTDLAPVMLTFADQLLSLLGVPSTPPSLALRIARLKRERATSLVLSASSTLGALVRLTNKLESIAIPASVATSVDLTLSHLESACSNLRNGEYQLALENARVAEAEAEKAFFEPSMVGQVYFPDEHKVAVYVPLLGPMAVPLVMSALKELKSWKEGRRKVKTL